MWRDRSHVQLLVKSSSLLLPSEKLNIVFCPPYLPTTIEGLWGGKLTIAGTPVLKLRGDIKAASVRLDYASRRKQQPLGRKSKQVIVMGFVSMPSIFTAQRRNAVASNAASGVSNAVGTAHLKFTSPKPSDVSLLLIHPIGVGLNGQYWKNFLEEFERSGCPMDVYAPDLLGCGDNKENVEGVVSLDMIARDLEQFVLNTIQKPVVVMTEGNLVCAGVDLARKKSLNIRGFVTSTPPPFRFFTTPVKPWIPKLAWLFFSSPLGIPLFYYVRRREFLRKFTENNLFSGAADNQWLDTLEKEAQDLRGRWAVFSFLASRWRRDYRAEMSEVTAPSLLLMGSDAKVITNKSFSDTVDERFEDYRAYLKSLELRVVPNGRNVLAYEKSEETVSEVVAFLNKNVLSATAL